MNSITPDATAAIVATVLGVNSATAYTPTDPRFGVIVIPDETWLGRDYVEYVRIDGLQTSGYPTAVELHTTAGTFSDTDAHAHEHTVAARIRDAILAVQG